MPKKRTTAKKDDTVLIHYTVSLEDGRQVGSTKENKPIELTIGTGTIFPTLESALEGMKADEKKTVTLEPKDGVGEYRQDLLLQLERSSFPPQAQPQPGMRLTLKSDKGQERKAVVKAVEGDKVILDANLPLAGRKLVFELELVEIKSSNP